MADYGIGRSLNRVIRQGASNFADEARTGASQYARVPGELASDFQRGQQDFTGFLGDLLTGGTPPKPNTFRAAVTPSAMPHTDKVAEGAKSNPGTTKTESLSWGRPHISDDRDRIEEAPPQWQDFETKDKANQGSVSFADRGGPDAPYTQVGLRQRAAQTAVPDYGEMQKIAPQLAAAANNYDRPNGGAVSSFTRNPLLSLSAGQLAQDEGVRQEREGRYGGIRQAALARDEDELKRAQLGEQMKDPLGYGRLELLARIERDKAYGVNRDKATIQSEAEKARAAGYLKDAGAIDEEEAAKLAALETYPGYAALPLIEQQRRKDVIKATANERRQQMERSHSYGEKFNAKDQGPTF